MTFRARLDRLDQRTQPRYAVTPEQIAERARSFDGEAFKAAMTEWFEATLADLSPEQCEARIASWAEYYR